MNRTARDTTRHSTQFQPSSLRQYFELFRVRVRVDTGQGGQAGQAGHGGLCSQGGHLVSVDISGWSD